MAPTDHEASSNRAVAILIGCIAQTLHQSDPTFLARLETNLDSLGRQFQQHGNSAENKLIFQVRKMVWDENMFPRKK